MRRWMSTVAMKDRMAAKVLVKHVLPVKERNRVLTDSVQRSTRHSALMAEFDGLLQAGGLGTLSSGVFLQGLASLRYHRQTRTSFNQLTEFGVKPGVMMFDALLQTVTTLEEATGVITSMHAQRVATTTQCWVSALWSAQRLAKGRNAPNARCIAAWVAKYPLAHLLSQPPTRLTEEALVAMYSCVADSQTLARLESVRRASGVGLSWRLRHAIIKSCVATDNLTLATAVHAALLADAAVSPGQKQASTLRILAFAAKRGDLTLFERVERDHLTPLSAALPAPPSGRAPCLPSRAEPTSSADKRTNCDGMASSQPDKLFASNSSVPYLNAPTASAHAGTAAKVASRYRPSEVREIGDSDPNHVVQEGCAQSKPESSPLVSRTTDEPPTGDGKRVTTVADAKTARPKEAVPSWSVRPRGRGRAQALYEVTVQLGLFLTCCEAALRKAADQQAAHQKVPARTTRPAAGHRKKTALVTVACADQSRPTRHAVVSAATRRLEVVGLVPFAAAPQGELASLCRNSISFLLRLRDYHAACGAAEECAAVESRISELHQVPDPCDPKDRVEEACDVPLAA
ncbi:hypothetical protein DIPPA_25312 [Diplonema papillatum]|nr:hypothetical protein DIPPA_25312 [Diplonema papillatum]|eukprot:gene4365-6759_t